MFFEFMSHLDVPLWFDDRFNDISRSLADAEFHWVWCLVSEQTQLSEVLDDLCSHVVSQHALVLATVLVDASVVVEDVDELEVVPLSAHKVVWIVGWCHLHCTCSEVHVNQDWVSNDLDDSVWNERMHKFLADQVFVSWVFWMNCHSSISKHGLDTGGCNYDLFVAFLGLVSEVDQYTELIVARVSRHLHLGRLRDVLHLYLKV